MDLFQQAGHLFAGAGLLFSSFLGGHPTAVLGQSTGPAVTSQNFSAENYYRVTRSVNYEGYNVKLIIKKISSKLCFGV